MFSTFESISGGQIHDIFRTDLVNCLCDPRLDAFDHSPWDVPPEAAAAAFDLALALGKCLICGVQLPEELDGTLPAPEAAAAAQVLASFCEELCQLIESLDERWQAAETSEEAELLLAEVFEGLMETYAVMEALSQTYLALLDDNDPDLERFLPHFDRAVAATRKLDDKAQDEEVLALLSMVVELPLYENWKNALAEPYASAPPWWLAGVLEEAAHRVVQETDSLLEEIWLKTAPPAKLPQVPCGHVIEPKKFFPPKVLLAAAAPSERSSPGEVCWWQSPDGKFLARLSMPSQYPSSGLVPVEILDHKGRQAAGWADRPVRLCGIEAPTDQDGVARFPVDQLAEAAIRSGNVLVLEVGSPPERWTPIEPPELLP